MDSTTNSLVEVVRSAILLAYDNAPDGEQPIAMATAAINAVYEAIKEPSEEMVTAAMHALDTPFYADIERGYRAMLAASPIAPSKAEKSE